MNQRKLHRGGGGGGEVEVLITQSAAARSNVKGKRRGRGQVVHWFKIGSSQGKCEAFFARLMVDIEVIANDMCCCGVIKAVCAGYVA